MPYQGAPGIFTQKLAELTEWQRQQQEKLLREQETQREILSKEQKRMCDVYGRPVEPSSPDSRRSVHSPEVSHGHTTDKPSGRVSLDDVPLPLQEKDFNDFLQEKLHEDTSIPRQQTSNKPKRPFLRKGQGLARFRLNADDRPKHSTSKKLVSGTANKNTPGGKRRESGNAVDSHSSKGCTDNIPEVRGSDADARPNGASTSNGRRLETATDLRESRPNVPMWTHVESHFKAPTWAHVLSQTRPGQVQGDVSTEKRKRELEELRVFELLEQKAANSSFCSTSSAIAQLMSKSVQSTPIKSRRSHQHSADADSSLHVRFADTQDYRDRSYSTDSEGDDCAPQGGVSRVIGAGGDSATRGTGGESATRGVGGDSTTRGAGGESVARTVEVPPIVRRDFRDTRAWSDDDSTASSDSTSQSRSSCGTNDETLTADRNHSAADSTLDSRTSTLDSRVPIPRRDSPEDLSGPRWQEPRTPEPDATGSGAFLCKSDLLRTRLQDLENEIETFRKENATLSKLRRSHELEVLAYRREKKEAERKLKEEHESLKVFLDGEKKKLAKEKLVYERYAKELKNRPSKGEREEITGLKVQVEHLREELVKKDSRWSATQVRTRDRLRQLESENSELKKRIQTLKHERQEARQFKTGLQNGLRTSRVSNTKIIHAINDHIGKIIPKEESLKNSFVIKNVVPKRPIPKSTFSKQVAPAGHRGKGANLRCIQSVPDMGVTSSTEDGSQTPGDSGSDSGSDPGSEVKMTQTKVGARLDAMRKTIYDTMYGEPSPGQREEEAELAGRQGVELTGTQGAEELGEGTAVETVRENGNREKVYADGRRETWYPNGNVKKVSPDKAVVKVIYFNGDVKETLTRENVVKYYYAETRTWHTTLPDGNETLEFPNGQVERRSPDGSTEITFSNGCVRLCHADGRDEWAFPDGTRVNTTTAGDKVVQLSNGQREVHTLEHKRREYPDGTVKLVYPDGLQETRYANGRIRLRDKDGTLILDSAAEN